MSLAGPGIYPFGSKADLDTYVNHDIGNGSADVPLALGLFIPIECYQNSSVTNRAFQYRPKNSNHQRVFATLVVDDLLRQFVKYRELPHDTKPKKAAKFNKPSGRVDERHGPYQSGRGNNVRTQTTLYTSLLLPLAPSQDQGNNKAIHRFWEGDYQREAKDEKQERERFRMQDILADTLPFEGAEEIGIKRSSALLGDSDTWADKSVQKYQASTFIGRLEEVLVLDLGETLAPERHEEDDPETIKDDERMPWGLLSFDSFCMEFLRENRFQYEKNPGRKAVIDEILAREKSCNRIDLEPAAMADKTNAARTSWKAVFGDQLSPAELILNVDSFLQFCAELNPNVPWTQVSKEKKRSGQVFSTFYDLEKQLNLIPTAKVHKDFKLLENYVRPEVKDDLEKGRPCFKWPGLRKRYVTINDAPSHELEWRQIQNRPMPVPADIASYPEQKFQEWFKGHPFETSQMTAKEKAFLG